MDVMVDAVAAVTDEVADAVARLLPQLSPGSAAPDREQLERIVAGPATTLLLARRGGPVVGMLTLVRVRVPSGLLARIEDVVVDEGARRHGVGEALTRTALAMAFRDGATSVDLTSRPSREAAHRLYRRLGFEVRDTAVYRHRGG
jgi:ribosomal protein S18 acetylase RimI-like enzyme